MPPRVRDSIVEGLLTSPQRRLRNQLTRFSKEIAPMLSEMHEREEIDPKILRRIRAMRLSAIGLPEEYGGRGGGLVSACIREEALGYASAALALRVSIPSGVTAKTILALGTKKQKQSWVPKLARGVVGTFQLTEPNAGSDAAALETTAVIRGRRVFVTGEKTLVTNGEEGKLAVVFTRVPDSSVKGKFHSTAILVPDSAPHLSKARENKLGLRSSHTSSFSYQEVPLSTKHILGGKRGIGMGFRGAMWALDDGRVDLSAVAVGMAQRALDESKEHFRRYLEGNGTEEEKAGRTYIASMAGLVEKMRRMVYTVAAESQKSREFTAKAAKTKSEVTDDLNRVTDLAMSVGGMEARTENHPIGILWRDARVFPIFEGTNQIQQMVVAGLELPKPRRPPS